MISSVDKKILQCSSGDDVILRRIVEGTSAVTGEQFFKALVKNLAAAGISWGVYSVRERGVHDPIVVTGDNFLRSLPFVFASLLFFLPSLEIFKEGICLAILSGGIATAIGYVLWYSAVWGDLKRFEEINKKYFLDMDFGSVPGLCERFGLTFPGL